MRKIASIAIRLITAVILLLPASISLSAQEQMTISLSDDTIEFNETVTVSLTATVKDFKFFAELPASDGFYVTENLNNFTYGSSSQMMEVTQSFTLSPLKAGTYYVGRAWIQSGSKRIFSNQLTLTIKPQAESRAARNFFIYTQPSKTKAMVGEPIEVKVWAFCAEGNSFEPSSDEPSGSGYNGFWHYDGVYDEVVPYEKKTITVKGKKYIGFPIYTEYLFPNSTGRLALPVYSYYCSVQNRPFGDYSYDRYYGSDSENEVERKTDSVFVTIDPLPADGRPADFRGDVGAFTIEAEADRSELNAYEAVNITVTISGIGNINAIQIPDPVFPAGFEHFSPQTSDETTQSDAGIIGTKKFSFRVIPTKEGDYTISGITFSYFDAAKKSYVSLKAKDIPLKVNPGKPIQQDTTVNNLPDGFLTPVSPVRKVMKALLYVIVPVAILASLLIWWMRRKKRLAAIARAEEATIEKPAPPPGYEFRLMLKNADALYSQRNIQAAVHLLYETLHSAVSKKCELDRPEASVSQIRYRLSTKKFAPEQIDELVAFLEKSGSLRYSWSGQNPELLRKIFAEAPGFLTKLGY